MELWSCGVFVGWGESMKAGNAILLSFVLLSFVVKKSRSHNIDQSLPSRLYV